MDQTTTILSEIGCLGRTHSKFSTKQKYRDILAKVVKDGKIKGEINVRRGARRVNEERVNVMTMFADKENRSNIKDFFINQKELLIAQGIYFVPRGDFADYKSLNYKNNMFYLQQLLESEGIKKVTLLDFNYDNMVQNCADEKSIKAHLMMIKAKDRNPLFLAVEFEIRKENSDIGSVYCFHVESTRMT